MFAKLLKSIIDPKLPEGVLPEDLFRVKIINYTIFIPIIGTSMLLLQSLINREPDYLITASLILVMLILIIINNTKYHYYSKALLFVVTPLGILIHGHYCGPVMRMDLNFIMMGALAFGVYDSLRVKILITVWSIIAFVLYHIIAKPDALMAQYVNDSDPYVVFSIVAVVSAMIIHIYFKTQKANLEKQRILNETLSTNNRELKDALTSIQDRNLIFQSIGHDLRTPAAAFNKLSQKINHLIKNGDIERLKDLGAQFESSGNKISYLIQNILNWANSEVEDYALQIESINLDDYTKSSIMVHQILATEKGIDITTSIPTNLYVDSDINYLSIIINNIIHNAIKYSHPNSEIHLEAILCDNSISLSIIDHGIGMSGETLTKIKSDDNVKSQKGTNRETGYGLGMKTCYKIAQRLDIDLVIESEVDLGTRMTLRFPRS